MKRKKLKVGDKVPIEDNLYYIVEKTFVASDTTDEYEDYSYYKVGDPIVIKSTVLKEYALSFKDFLNNNCRPATDDEIRNIYNEKYSNARVGKVYKDGSYNVLRFFIVTSHHTELWGKFDLKKDNCYWALRLEMSELIGKLCGEQYISNVCIGTYKGKLFLFTEFDRASKNLLNICRCATAKEASELCQYVNEVQAVYSKKIEEEERKKKEAKAKIYEANKSNSEYFPGACGNYKQVLLEEGRKIVPEKEYSLEQIKKFYQTLLDYEGLSDEVKSNLIFYGGTIPYILCNEGGETRKFGDVDIFLPVSIMQRLRDELEQELNFVYDTIEITRSISFTAKGFRVKPSWSNCKSYVEYRIFENCAEEGSVYQDYGFKAILFGMNISVFPLYDWTFEDGSIGVCAKSFRMSREEGDWNFLLNTIIAKEITIDDFCYESSIFGHNVKVAKTEYTIASKRNAIKFGYVLRKDTDETDLRYIEGHISELRIDESQVKFFMKNIPDYGISCAYRITRAGDVCKIGPEAYKQLVTRNDKPS